MHIHSAIDLIDFINTRSPAEFKSIIYRGHALDLVDVINSIDQQTKARFLLFYAKNYQLFADSTPTDVLATGLNLDKQDLMKLLNLLPQDELNKIFADQKLPETLAEYTRSARHYEYWLEIFKQLTPSSRLNAVQSVIESML